MQWRHCFIAVGNPLGCLPTANCSR